MFVRLSFALVSLCTLAACGQSSRSGLDGHYEDATADLMQTFDSEQRAVAEFEDTRGVIISLPLLTDNFKEQMAADILASGVDTLWIAVPSNFRGDLYSREFARLRSVLGSDIGRVQLVKQKVAGPLTVWARDWAPLGAKAADNSLRLLDFNYYSDRSADDSTARSLLPVLPVERVSVPVYNEGGNFMNNTRGVCLMTTRVTDANAKAERSDDQVLDAAGVKSYYKRFAGCEQTTIFPRMPYEGTGHIDMWAKFLDDDTVLVGELRDEVVELPGYTTSESTKVKRLQQYLNDRAAQIAGLGFQVVRMPMPAPSFSKEGDVFRSYTNSLTINGSVLVPRYVTPAFEDLAVDGAYIDTAYTAGYEQEVNDIYRRYGYRFKWVDSDDLIAVGGAVHCTTMQIAR